jgi:hypothetical protein
MFLVVFYGCRKLHIVKSNTCVFLLLENRQCVKERDPMGNRKCEEKRRILTEICMANRTGKGHLETSA